MNTISIKYPPEVLWAMQQDPKEFEREARILLAVKLYESGKLTTGLAAQIADVPRVTFIHLLGQYGLSPFGETTREIARDLKHARQARRR